MSRDQAPSSSEAGPKSGGGACVSRRRPATRASAISASPGGRVLSRSSPSTPPSANRACQRQTVVFGDAGGGHYRVRAEAIGREEDDSRAPSMLLRCVAIGDDGFEPPATAAETEMKSRCASRRLA